MLASVWFMMILLVTAVLHLLRALVEKGEAYVESRKNSAIQSSAQMLLSWFIRPIHTIIRSVGGVPQRVQATCGAALAIKWLGVSVIMVMLTLMPHRVIGAMHTSNSEDISRVDCTKIVVEWGRENSDGTVQGIRDALGIQDHCWWSISDKSCQFVLGEIKVTDGTKKLLRGIKRAENCFKCGDYGVIRPSIKKIDTTVEVSRKTTSSWNAAAEVEAGTGPLAKLVADLKVKISGSIGGITEDTCSASENISFELQPCTWEIVYISMEYIVGKQASASGKIIFTPDVMEKQPLGPPCIPVSTTIESVNCILTYDVCIDGVTNTGTDSVGTCPPEPPWQQPGN